MLSYHIYCILFNVANPPSNVDQLLLDWFNVFISPPWMHNIGNMLGVVAQVGFKNIMRDCKEAQQFLIDLDHRPDSGEGKIVGSVKAEREIINSAVLVFETFCLGSTGKVHTDQALDTTNSTNSMTVLQYHKLQTTRQRRELTPQERAMFAPMYRLATLLTSLLYSKQCPTAGFRLSGLVMPIMLFILLFLASIRYDLDSKSDKWITRSIYSQDFLTHLWNWLNQFRMPPLFALEEMWEAAFQSLVLVSEEKRSKFVQWEEALHIFWSERMRDQGMCKQTNCRSGVAQKLQTFPQSSLFIAFCMFSVHPMAATNIRALISMTAEEKEVC